MAKTDFKTIDEYIGIFPKDVQKKLEKIRQTIRKAAPEAKEVISYQMPTFRQMQGEEGGARRGMTQVHNSKS